MVRILADGEQRHRLEDADGNHIGWIRGRAVAFALSPPSLLRWPPQWLRGAR
jgi:hypothetical protein